MTPKDSKCPNGHTLEFYNQDTQKIEQVEECLYCKPKDSKCSHDRGDFWEFNIEPGTKTKRLKKEIPICPVCKPVEPIKCECSLGVRGKNCADYHHGDNVKPVEQGKSCPECNGTLKMKILGGEIIDCNCVRGNPAPLDGVKRYDFSACTVKCHDMIENKDGFWIGYHNYSKLKADHEAAMKVEKETHRLVEHVGSQTIKRLQDALKAKEDYIAKISNDKEYWYQEAIRSLHQLMDKDAEIAKLK